MNFIETYKIDHEICDNFIDLFHKFKAHHSHGQIIKNDGTILCDDYDLTYAPGVKKAIDEFVASNNYKVEILFNRFAKITKN